MTGLSGRCFLPMETGVITEVSHMISCAAAGTNHKTDTSLSCDRDVTSTDPWKQGFVAPQVAGWSSISPFQLKNMTCRLSEHPDYAVQFSFMVIFGQAIQHSVISVESEITASMTCQLLKCCRWVVARKTCMVLWSLLSMCGIHLAQTSHFPKVVVRIP
jgi:hypothetical protein